MYVNRKVIILLIGSACVFATKHCPPLLQHNSHVTAKEQYFIKPLSLSIFKAFIKPLSLFIFKASLFS